MKEETMISDGSHAGGGEEVKDTLGGRRHFD